MGRLSRKKEKNWNEHKINTERRAAVAKITKEAVMPLLPTPSGSDGLIGNIISADAPERALLLDCGNKFRELMGHREFSSLVVSLVAFRRAYGMALRDISNKLSDASDTPPEMVDYVSKIVGYLAAKPFNEQELLSGCIDTAIPWLLRTIQNDVTEAQRTELALKAQNAVAPIPIGFKHTFEQPDEMIRRGESLLLLGRSDLIQFVLNRAVESATCDGQFTVLYLYTVPSQRCLESQGGRFTAIGKSLWTGFANSEKTFLTCMGSAVKLGLPRNPDLIICDNLALAHTTRSIERPPTAEAGDAHRKLRRYLTNMPAIIGAIPTAVPVSDDDLLGIEYEQLRVHTFLRKLAVQSNGSDRFISIGTGSLLPCPESSRSENSNVMG